MENAFADEAQWWLVRDQGTFDHPKWMPAPRTWASVRLVKADDSGGSGIDASTKRVEHCLSTCTHAEHIWGQAKNYCPGFEGEEIPLDADDGKPWVRAREDGVDGSAVDFGFGF